MKNIYAISGFMAFIMMLCFSPSTAQAEYRLEHNACGFSFVTPDAPAIIPVWEGEEKYYAPFVKEAPIAVRTDSMQALKIVYNVARFDTPDSLQISAYCMEFDPEVIASALSPDEMLIFLKNAIGAVDKQSLKDAFSGAHIDFSEQANGIKWLKVRAVIQESEYGEQILTSYVRDIFSYQNKVLILFVEYSAENKQFKQQVQNMLSSLIVPE